MTVLKNKETRGIYLRFIYGIGWRDALIDLDYCTETEKGKGEEFGILELGTSDPRA